MGKSSVIKEVLKELSIFDYDIIGSANDPNIDPKLSGDIDSQDFINIDNNDIATYTDILKHYQNIYNKLKGNKSIIITDFKCGVDIANIPIRWNYKSIMDGYTTLDNNKTINFIDTLQQKSIIKIDLIVKETNNRFIEVSMNYYYIFGKSSTYDIKDRNEIATSLKKDVFDYRSKDKYYKSIKRLYSYYKIIKKKGNKMDTVIDLINSEYGVIAKQINDLDLITEIIDNKYFSKDEIYYNLKNINETVKDDKLKNMINNNSSLNTINKYLLNELLPKLTERINKDLKPIIDKYKLI